jgi:hypothetical protein
MPRSTLTRGVGLLVALTVVIAAGTLAQDLRFDSALAEERAHTRALDREFGWLSASVANLRAAQAGYIATGQNSDYWIDQVNSLSGDLEMAIRQRQAATPVEATRKHYESAATALAAFVAVDGRARSYVRADQRLLASDLIFMESIQALARLTGAVDAARTAETAASEARLNRMRMLRVGLNGVAIAFVVAVALFFWRALMSAQDSQPEPVHSIGLTGQQSRVIPPPPPAAIAPAPAPAPPAPGLSLAEAAALCGDLARVADTRDVPPLFDRAAVVLSAKGAVLWVADSGGSMLRPSLTHGYSDRVVAKLGLLTADADNLTSLAYRSMRPQSVSGAPGSPGAIAVPLLSSAGCVGVLAAETRQQQPGQDVLPVAQMIAAQFAALVAPAATPGQKTG